jgi:hypothetical protein
MAGKASDRYTISVTSITTPGADPVATLTHSPVAPEMRDGRGGKSPRGLPAFRGRVLWGTSKTRFVTLSKPD